MIEPRGIRNNNPGNIRHGDAWEGLSEIQTDSSFCQFDDPEYGIRALCRILITYQKKHNLKTIKEMISRWAPPSENDTDSYVVSVSQAVGITWDYEFDIKDFPVTLRLVQAIITHENGEDPYDYTTVVSGLKLAGLGRRVEDEIRTIR